MVQISKLGILASSGKGTGDFIPGTTLVYDVAVGEDGGYTIAGGFTATFGLLSPTIGILNSGGYDAFAATFTDAGVPTWAQTIGGAGADRARGVAVHGDFVAVGGEYQQAVVSLISDGDPLEMSTAFGLPESNGRYDAFAVQLLRGAGGN